MSKDSANTSTRRSFLKSGALLAVPVAAASVPGVVLADDGLKARVKRLQDEAAIRELHQSWLRQVNAGERAARLDGAVRRITDDHAGAPDKIEIAADGRSAVGLFDCAVEVETPLARDCTLAQMAHAQGNGTFRRAERRTLTVDYTKANGTWKIAKASLTTL
ncbi:MAG TPA: hypothetical protein VHX52_06890 [Steroidobacteraceae bacterium]|nr:hypothetical protein [Steroidobacteraceae bacterium]